MKNIEAVKQELINNFAMFDSWDDKYEYIIELGKKLKPLDSKYKTDEYKIKGCQSNVWLTAKMENGLVIFEADSDAIIVKGLVAILIEVFSGNQPQTIIDSDLKFMDEIGLTKHLAQTRSNGLLAMVKQMKFYAMAFQTQLSK
jgi:cysteine desulfuration protein SufE